MFFTYLRRELRRRMRQAVFIAVGLALGVGLVITVTAASAGVRNAQGTVLHALYGMGTDVTVTKTPKAGSFSPGSFGVGGGGGFPGAGGGGGGGGSGGGPGAGAFRPAGSGGHTVAVHLSAAVSTNVILIAVLLAVLGGLIAGIFGGWRAARLRPADALSKVA